MKVLIDECLSPVLVELALEAGCAGSTHVTWLGMSAAKDWAVARRAVDDGFVLVTHNRLDIKLYGRGTLHGGLVVLNAAHGMVDRDQQRRLFALALARLAGPEPSGSGFYNEVLEVTLAVDGAVTIRRYAHPE